LKGPWVMRSRRRRAYLSARRAAHGGGPRATIRDRVLKCRGVAARHERLPGLRPWRSGVPTSGGRTPRGGRIPDNALPPSWRLRNENVPLTLWPFLWPVLRNKKNVPERRENVPLVPKNVPLGVPEQKEHPPKRVSYLYRLFRARNLVGACRRQPLYPSLAT
jgi:hypothetical protein